MQVLWASCYNYNKLYEWGGNLYKFRNSTGQLKQQREVTDVAVHFFKVCYEQIAKFENVHVKRFHCKKKFKNEISKDFQDGFQINRQHLYPLHWRRVSGTHSLGIQHLHSIIL